MANIHAPARSSLSGFISYIICIINILFAQVGVDIKSYLIIECVSLLLPEKLN